MESYQIFEYYVTKLDIHIPMNVTNVSSNAISYFLIQSQVWLRITQVVLYVQYDPHLLQS